MQQNNSFETFRIDNIKYLLQIVGKEERWSEGRHTKEIVGMGWRRIKNCILEKNLRKAVSYDGAPWWKCYLIQTPTSISQSLAEVC